MKPQAVVGQYLVVLLGDSADPSSADGKVSLAGNKGEPFKLVYYFRLMPEPGAVKPSILASGKAVASDMAAHIRQFVKVILVTEGLNRHVTEIEFFNTGRLEPEKFTYRDQLTLSPT